MLQHPNILDANKLKQRLEFWRASGKRIVFTNGCYDILHPGHVDLLARARALGDILLLGVNSDASVRRLGKGSRSIRLQSGLLCWPTLTAWME